jgi:hypothetical protein
MTSGIVVDLRVPSYHALTDAYYECGNLSRKRKTRFRFALGLTWMPLNFRYLIHPSCLKTATTGSMSIYPPEQRQIERRGE